MLTAAGLSMPTLPWLVSPFAQTCRTNLSAWSLYSADTYAPPFQQAILCHCQVIGYTEHVGWAVLGSVLQVLLDGQDIKGLPLSWLREQVGLVSQEPVLFATTIGRNIGFGRPRSSQQDIEEAAKAANAHNFITSLPKG